MPPGATAYQPMKRGKQRGCYDFDREDIESAFSGERGIA